MTLGLKDLKCLHRAERSEVWALIAGILKEEMLAQQPVQTVMPEPPQKKAALLVASDSESDKEEDDCTEKCLECFKAEPVISMEDCLLQWWSKHAGAYNKLACLAHKYLATPATSVPCGRLFSPSGHIVQRKRAALSSGNVTRRVCLSNWLSATK